MRTLVALFAVLLVACQVESQAQAQAPVVVAPLPVVLATPAPTPTPKEDVRVVTCEAPTAVRTGCLCGNQIMNPCEWGGNFPVLEGNSCIFTCPARP